MSKTLARTYTCSTQSYTKKKHTYVFTFASHNRWIWGEHSFYSLLQLASTGTPCSPHLMPPSLLCHKPHWTHSKTTPPILEVHTIPVAPPPTDNVMCQNCITLARAMQIRMLLSRHCTRTPIAIFLTVEVNWGFYIGIHVLTFANLFLREKVTFILHNPHGSITRKWRHCFLD